MKSVATAAAILTLSALSLSAGCAGAGGGGGVSRGSAESAPAPSPGVGGDRYEAMSALGYQPQWNAQATLARGAKMAFFDAYDDILIAQGSSNVISVMEASTGTRRWSLDLADKLVKFVGNIRNDAGDIISSSDSEVFVLDQRTGVIKERQQLAIIVSTAPQKFGTILVYGSPSGEALGHNLASGYKQWGFQLNGGIEAEPVRIGSNVALVSQRGEIANLDPRSGGSVGRARIFSGLRNDPVASQGALFVAAEDQSVWAFAPSGGNPLWRARTEHRLTGQPAHHDGVLYVPIPVEGLTAFAGGTGERLWSAPEVTGEVIAVRAGKLIVRQKDEVLAVNAASGEVETRVKLRGLSMIVPDAFEDGNVYLVEPGGRIQKFSPR